MILGCPVGILSKDREVVLLSVVNGMVNGNGILANEGRGPMTRESCI